MFFNYIIFNNFHLSKKLENIKTNMNDKITSLEKIIKNQINLRDNQENIIKQFDFHNLLLYQQIEAIFSYI